jgi:two-component system chemotaxis response regulator CheB
MADGPFHPNNRDPKLEDRIAREIQIAAGRDLSPQTVLDLGELSAFTCTECHGVLVQIVEDKLTRFRCHTGHGFTEDALMETMTQVTGDLIWQAVRGLQETEMLLEHMGHHFQEAGDAARVQKFLSKAREIGREAAQFHELAVRHDQFTATKLEEEADQEKNKS